ncbi:MAG: DnaA/Hda family protein, partial [Actinomycetota bacterium]
MSEADLAAVWARSLDELAEMHIEPAQRAWLQLTRPLGLVENTALIATPNEFVKEQLETRLRSLITNALSRELGRSIQLAVTVDPAVISPMPIPAAEQEHRMPAPPGGADQSLDRMAGRAPVSRMPGGHSQPMDARDGPPDLPLHRRLAQDRDLGGDMDPVTGRPRSSGAGGQPGPAAGAPRPGQTRLNPKYTFETFVIGSSNRFAHAAAVAVAEAPAKAYNPLFVYGDSGLGKTHLLHAVGHYAQSLYQGIRVRYVSSEEFTNDFINMIRDGKQDGFRRRYRDVDILLVDDIQFLENKEGTQEEFFHTFNTLHNASKQIVISSDRAPKRLVTLED